MTLQEYINGLLEFVKENPSAADMEVVYSKDDEGNGYQTVNYTPNIGYFEDDSFRQPNEEEDFEYEFNAVCIN